MPGRLTPTRPYGIDTALYLALACDAVRSADWLTIRDALDFDVDCTVLPGVDHFAAVGETKDYTLVIFRGSMTLDDWATDLRADLQSFPGWPGRAHHGFAAAADSMWPWLRNVTSRDKPLWVTGHSLGGAIATLAAYLFVRDGFERVAPVYTFGAPRVGDQDFAVSVDAALTLYRTVHDNDPVPHVPLAINGYAHAGEERWLDGKGAINGSPSWGKAVMNILSHASHGLVPLLHDSLADHSISEYLAALTQVRTLTMPKAA